MPAPQFQFLWVNLYADGKRRFRAKLHKIEHTAEDMDRMVAHKPMLSQTDYALLAQQAAMQKARRLRSDGSARNGGVFQFDFDGILFESQKSRK